MSAPGDSAGTSHSVQKFLLIRARVFARQLNFDVQGLAIRNAMAPNIGLAVLTDTDDRAVLGVELPYRMVDGITAVSAKRSDNLVL